MRTKTCNFPSMLVLTLIVTATLLGLMAQEASAAAPALTVARWNATQQFLRVAGTGWGKGQNVTVTNSATGDVLGAVQANIKGAWTLTVNGPAVVPCSVWATSAKGFAQKSVANRPAACSSSANTLAFSFNNLGMHCYDSDYSVFSILPPFNTVHAQVVRRGAGGSLPAILDPLQAKVYYRGIADKAGSVNTTSTNKTNFWDYVLPLFGAPLLIDEGLTGHRMPGSGNMPQAFNDYDPLMKWFTASGIPITAWDNRNKRNHYPLMQIQPFDTSTAIVPPATHTVLPVSDEMHCSVCHSTGQDAADTATKTSTLLPQTMAGRDRTLSPGATCSGREG